MLRLIQAGRRVSAVVLLGAVLAGCAGQAGLSPALEADLVARVEARWRALEALDYATAYDFMSPAYRAVFTREMYLTQFSYMAERKLTSVEILNYDAPAAVASVVVGVMSRPVKQTSAASAAIGAVSVKSVEQWVLRNNTWWFSVNK
jgi:hypothetical protein